MLASKETEYETQSSKDVITVEITIDELKVKNHYLNGKLTAVAEWHQTVDGDTFMPLKVTNIDSLEWIDDIGNDRPVSRLKITCSDVLSYLQAYAERYETALNNSNVREI